MSKLRGVVALVDCARCKGSERLGVAWAMRHPDPDE
jgi:hypothetical protein